MGGFFDCVSPAFVSHAPERGEGFPPPVKECALVLSLRAQHIDQFFLCLSFSFAQSRFWLSTPLSPTPLLFHLLLFPLLAQASVDLIQYLKRLDPI